MWKTVAITLISVLGACLITFGSLALFAPATVANFFDGLGAYNASIRYYEKQYGKSESIDDLAVLILKLDQTKDSEKTEKYVKIIIEHSDYAQYCNQNDQNDNNNVVSTNELYYGKYALALIRNGKFSNAISIANKFVSENGYTKYNPFSTIILELGNELESTKLNKIKTEITQYLGGEYENYVQADIDAIQQILNNN